MARIVIGLNYYTPYVSGLTNVARDVAEGLVARGHSVLVVAAQHDPALPLRETTNGVQVVRCPVRVRFGKGVIAPSLVSTIVRAARGADVVNLHAPMLEAGLVARRLSRLGLPLILTYHCDISLDGMVGRMQIAAMDVSTAAAARGAAAVVVSSADYAENSRIAGALSARQVVITPGCHVRRGGSPTFRSSSGLHVGFLGRFVEEKGIEYLVDGFAAHADPDARLLLAGDFANVAGGSIIERVRERIGGDQRIKVLGFLEEGELADFYASLDAFALVSVNSFEAFGIVQVEAMMAGVPAIASDMPGVRQPVQQTGFGEVIAPRDAGAVTRVLAQWDDSTFDRSGGAAVATGLFENERSIDRYDELIEGLVPR